MTDPELKGIAAQALNMARLARQREEFNFLLATYHPGEGLHRMKSVEKLIVEKLGKDWLNSGRRKDVGMGLIAFAVAVGPNRPDAVVFVTAANMFRETEKFKTLSPEAQHAIVNSNHDRHHQAVKEGLLYIVDSFIAFAQTAERVCNYIEAVGSDEPPQAHFFNQNEFAGRMRFYGRDPQELARELGLTLQMREDELPEELRGLLPEELVREIKKAFDQTGQRELLTRIYDPDTGRARHYKLVGQTAVPCSMLEWTQHFSDPAYRRVKLTEIGPFRVSTVFLGLDHRFSGKGEPLIFETMTFVNDAKLGDFEGQNDMDGRWSTWIEAEQAHDRAVRWLQLEYCHAGEEPKDVTDD